MASNSIQADQEIGNLIEQLEDSIHALYAMIDTARVAVIAAEDIEVQVVPGTMTNLMVHALKIIDGMGTTVDKLALATPKKLITGRSIMATANLTTADDDGARVHRLFEAMAILTGLEAYAAQEEDGSGVCTSLLQMSRTSRALITEVIGSMNP